MSQSPEIIPIVDENDDIIGYKERTLFVVGEIYRTSKCWITNSQGQILLAQRSRTKKHNPGRRGPAVAGTVAKGETYKENIYKEFAEELGISGYELTEGPKQFLNNNLSYFAQRYTLVLDLEVSDFIPQEEEVEQLEWADRDYLVQDFVNNPEKYSASVGRCLENL